MRSEPLFDQYLASSSKDWNIPQENEWINLAQVNIFVQGFPEYPL
jgi:hypothetical protein